MRILKLRPPAWVYLLFLIGACSLATRALLDSRFANSALLYLALPFTISLLLHHLVGYPENRDALGRYLNHLRNATIIMLATSAVLFEGFICVLMFMPIYFLAISIGYSFSLLLERSRRHRGSRIGIYTLPIVVAVLSFEGVAPETTFQRATDVTFRAVVQADIQSLKANMARPIVFDRPRHWFLSVFPLPSRVEAGSLAPGDVHRLHFVYKRWFFANVHRGDMRLRIEEVGKDHVRTTIVDNSSYLANYLKLEGTRVRFRRLDDRRTEVSLTITYQRGLDPAWYFGPLQRFAVERSAKYLVESVIAREGLDG